MVYDLKNFDYRFTPKEIFNILLLHNIETYKQSESQFRFPFNNFKEEKWSLEHIYAQNTDDFETIIELKAWIEELSNWETDINNRIDELESLKQNKKVKDDADNTNELENLKNAINAFKENTSPSIEKLILSIKNLEDSDEINDYQKELLSSTIKSTEELMGLHRLSNMALLDGNTNSGLGKKRFIDKRKYIIGVDQKKWDNGNNKKHFIPLCTKNIFLKYYTSNIGQMEFWGYKDKEDYLQNIYKTLSTYLTSENIK